MGASTVANLLHAEDLQVGRRFDLGTRHVDAEAIVAFAAEWDPLPMHIDPGAAGASPFGGLIASGLHTIAIAVRMVSDAVVRHSAVVAGRGMRDVQLLRPVRPGSELRGTLTVIGLEFQDRETAITVWQIELRDATGEAVLRIVSEATIRRRKAGRKT